MVVAVAGNVDHDEVVGLVREHFGAHLVRDRTAVPHRKGTGRVTGRPALELVNRDAEQTHMSLGVRVPGRHWKQRWALSVLNTALGGGLSSRLFQQIRETRGLAYSVYSTVDTFSDSGALSVYAACLPERFAEVARVTTDVLEEVARDGITEAECRIAKGSLRGGLVLGLEDSGSRMNRIGRSELNYGEHRSIDETLDADRRGHPRRGQRGGASAADQAVRRRGAGPISNQKVTAAAASGHRGLIGTVGAVNRLSRRSVLVGGLAVAGLAASAQRPVLADPAEPVPPVHDRIEALQRRHNTKIGVYAVDLESGRTVSFLDGEMFAMCSTFKGYAAARVLQKAERGELALDRRCHHRAQ